VTTYDVRLDGCRPEPLGAYLKALGVLRLVGEQVDPEARGWWAGETFALRSNLDEDSLVAFLVDDYRPTPIVAPWNGGSGFKEEKNPAAVAALGTIETSTLPRLAAYRSSIALARQIYDSTRDLAKEHVVARCRNELPDEAVSWIDGTVVLASDREVYPPLLGTGGNDGRFDFSKSFLERLADVLCLGSGSSAPARLRTEDWARDALFAQDPVRLLQDAIGQFDPGAAGGPNSSPVGAAPSLVNPWEWVLLVEGALLFASAAARRLGGTSGRAAVPFTFNATGAGFATAADENTRGELWVPLWERPSTAAEIGHLIGEGRADWRGSQARNGLDAARAVATLGTDRGVGSFVRFGLIERNGLATSAVVLGRQCPADVRAVPVVAQLDRWLDGVRRGGRAPAAVSAAARAVDRALFEHTTRPSGVATQQVLVAAAQLEETVERAMNFRRRAGIRPIFGLVAADWMPHLDDGSPEFDLARALASQRDGDGASLRLLLRPIHIVKGRLDWLDGGSPVAGLGRVALDRVLAAALQRRTLDCTKSASAKEDGVVGVAVAYDFAIPARAASVADWLDGAVNQQRLEYLLRAFLLLDWRKRVEGHRPEVAGEAVLPPSFALLAPFFAAQPVKHGEREVRLRVDAAWARLLIADRVGVVLDDALRRLRASRLRPRVSAPTVMAVSAPAGHALAAALSCPLDRRAVARLLAISVKSDDFEPVR
jgi:CRISPR-associated protein Csx17